MMKEAILELLNSYGDVWLKRTQIEEILGIASAYETDSGQSYDGGLAAMLLSELHGHRKIRSEKDADGRTWLYPLELNTTESRLGRVADAISPAA